MIRDNDAKAIKSIRSILKLKQHSTPKINTYRHFLWWLCVISTLTAIIITKSCEAPAMAYSANEGIYTNKIANAIYKTENSKNHPYGIIVKYKYTTPRQACINTIKHQLRLWNGQGDFIVFLGQTYSPPSINPNWVRLVNYFLNKERHNG